MPKFPSPTGDLYFSMAVKIEIAKSFKKVSVPYRGLIFLNLVSLVIDFLHNQFPSPTGDLYFSIDGWFTDDYQTVFPSPTGDLYFSIMQL